VGKKLAKKAMKYMGIKALYPKPKTTIGNKEHYKYPYLLKEFRNDAGEPSPLLLELKRSRKNYMLNRRSISIHLCSFREYFDRYQGLNKFY